MLVAKIDSPKGPSTHWGLLLQPTTTLISAPPTSLPPSPRTSSCFAAFLLLSVHPKLHPERSHAFPIQDQGSLTPASGGRPLGRDPERQPAESPHWLPGWEKRKGGAGLELVPSPSLPPGDAVAKGNPMRGREDGDGKLVPSPEQLCG